MESLLNDDGICDACPAANMRTDEQESLRCEVKDCLVHPDFRRIAIAQDAKSIAARDKWWRGLLQEVNEANDLKDLQERFAHLLRYTADLEVKQ